jgi:hypothetical protein
MIRLLICRRSALRFIFDILSDRWASRPSQLRGSHVSIAKFLSSTDRDERPLGRHSFFGDPIFQAPPRTTRFEPTFLQQAVDGC